MATPSSIAPVNPNLTAPTSAFPVVIESGHGERITFLGCHFDGEKEILEVEGRCAPGAGPVMHVHHLQEEGGTVLQGRMGYQLLGGPEQFAGVGEKVVFPAGVAHRFWAAGDEELIFRGYITPAHNVQYFLTAIYASILENGDKPGFWDGAFLTTRYRSEFDMPEIPTFVKRVIFPVVVAIGKVLGKYRKYAEAPQPL